MQFIYVQRNTSLCWYFLRWRKKIFHMRKSIILQLKNMMPIIGHNWIKYDAYPFAVHDKWLFFTKNTIDSKTESIYTMHCGKTIMQCRSIRPEGFYSMKIYILPFFFIYLISHICAQKMHDFERKNCIGFTQSQSDWDHQAQSKIDGHHHVSDLFRLENYVTKSYFPRKWRMHGTGRLFVRKV